jgi:hypothetical protein
MTIFFKQKVVFQVGKPEGLRGIGVDERLILKKQCERLWIGLK